MSNYIISPAAIQDLDEIADYFASHNLDAGDRFVYYFAEKCKNLAKYPNMGRSYADIEPSLRGIPLDSYIILYRVIIDGIEIVRVVSGYRNLKSLFSESNDE